MHGTILSHFQVKHNGLVACNNKIGSETGEGDIPNFGLKIRD